MANTESVSAQMEFLLDGYSLEIKEVAADSAEEAAENTLNMLHDISPVAERGKRKGRYRRGWRARFENNGWVVYNATDWQLTHLLENGHDIVRDGKVVGRSNAVPHIVYAEKFGIQDFNARISRGLK